MIIKTEKRGKVTIYYVEKDYDDNTLASKMNKRIRRAQIQTIIESDADVYTTDGQLLLRFRKNKLSEKKIKEFYDNVIHFSQLTTSNRGNASGSKIKNILTNPKIMTNIIGYYDRLSPMQKFMLKTQGKPIPEISVQETRFLKDFPDEFQRLVPLIEEIDDYYKKYIPEKYNKQKEKARQTPFHIADTAFTTITTNVNYQTTIHTDKGDDPEGFGNLTVIENGNYSGGETCFPQYGIGVNIKQGDIIFMDVHQPHGNLPIIKHSEDAKRLSIVCYLRYNIWKQTHGKTKKFMRSHIKMLNRWTRKHH